MKESKYSIKRVMDNKEKGLSFRENFNRYNKAKASEFYLECLWILYAMLEDRTSAFLYYLGFTDTKKRESVVEDAEIKTQVRQIFNMTKPKARYNFDSMKGKLSRIKEVLNWSSSADPITEYQQALKKATNNFLTNQEFMNSLEYLNDEWRDKRNQLTHSLFTKSPETVVSELKPLVEKGYMAARVFDKAVSELKKEKIRERFKLK